MSTTSFYKIPEASRWHNSSIPIAKLPAEVLCAIFLFNVVDNSSTEAYVFEPRAWMNVAFVCQFWRESAINCARIWSHWSVVEPGSMDAFISRSKGVPLSIRLSSLHRCSLARMFGNIETIERIRELHVTTADSQAMKVLFTQFAISEVSAGLPSPITSLRMSRHGCDPSGPPSFPNTACQYPKLRYLELVGINYDLRSTVFTTSSLTHLVLGSSRPHSKLQLLVFLNQQLFLEELALCVDLMPASAELLPHVQLPHLRKLNLTAAGNASDVFELVNHTAYPIISETTLGLPLSRHYFLERELRTEVVPFLFGYHRKTRAAIDGEEEEIPVIHRLSFHRTSTCYTVEIWHGSESSNEGSPTLPSLRLSLEWPEELIAKRDNLTKALLSTLPLAHVRKLSVHGTEASAESWVDALETMVDLEELDIQENADLVAAIFMTIHRRGSYFTSGSEPRGAAPPMLLPRLHSLQIQGAEHSSEVCLRSDD